MTTTRIGAYKVTVEPFAGRYLAHWGNGSARGDTIAAAQAAARRQISADTRAERAAAKRKPAPTRKVKRCDLSTCTGGPDTPAHRRTKAHANATAWANHERDSRRRC